MFNTLYQLPTSTQEIDTLGRNMVTVRELSPATIGVEHPGSDGYTPFQSNRAGKWAHSICILRDGRIT